jgi:hypothetical protein
VGAVLDKKRPVGIGMAGVALACLAACGSEHLTEAEWSEIYSNALAPRLTVRLVSMSVPPGSTLVAQPMGEGRGQQVPELRATVGITSDQAILGAPIEVFMATSQAHCLGAAAGSDLLAGSEAIVTTARMSDSPKYGDPPACPLPYTTTEVQVFVLDVTRTPHRTLVSARFPATYHFVAP